MSSIPRFGSSNFEREKNREKSLKFKSFAVKVIKKAKRSGIFCLMSTCGYLGYSRTPRKEMPQSDRQASLQTALQRNEKAVNDNKVFRLLNVYSVMF